MSEIVVTQHTPRVVLVSAPAAPSASPGVIEVESTRIGPPGPRGPEGPPGPILAHTHTQNVPSTTWIIEHGLGTYPQVSAMEFGGASIEGDVTYVDDNTMHLQFSALVSGTAYLS